MSRKSDIESACLIVRADGYVIDALEMAYDLGRLAQAARDKRGMYPAWQRWCGPFMKRLRAKVRRAGETK